MLLLKLTKYTLKYSFQDICKVFNVTLIFFKDSFAFEYLLLAKRKQKRKKRLKKSLVLKLLSCTIKILIEVSYC